jgi:hypothetical protein
MAFLVGGANTLDSSYEIDNSLRFNDGDSPSLQFTPSSDSNEQTWTVSFWVKRGVMGTSSSQMIFASDTNYDEYVFCRFCGTEVTGKEDMFQVFMVEPNAREGNVRTTRLFRDPSAWYHIVVRCDLTQGTAADRLRIYVNGVKETSFDTASYLNQNDDNVNWNSNVPQAIGHQKQASSVERHLDGYLSEFYNIDGTSLGPDSFGKTNDNGVWIPKQYTGSFGTNGYFLEFKQTGTSANSSGMGADTSGNDHHWTPANLAAIDVTVDTPTNNFCTFNPLDNAVLTLSEGNTKATHSTSSGGEENRGTMGFANGKWYWEFQIGYDVPTSRLQPYGIGLLTNTGRNPLESDLKTTEALTVHWYTDTSNNQVQERIFNTTTTVNASESYADNGDIVQFAIDADAGKVWVGKNNTYLDDASGNVGDPANGNNPIHTYTVVEGNFIFPAIVNVGSQGLTILLNTGNPSFAISSGNADANGYGNFEHAPPSGFYSICSKNLAEFG